MRRKRLADWLEKMSVALGAGAFLTDKGFWLPFIFACGSFAFSMYLSGKEK